MLKDHELIALAKRAGLYGHGFLPSKGALLRYGRAVAAAEREAQAYAGNETLLNAIREILALDLDRVGACPDGAKLQATMARLRALAAGFEINSAPLHHLST